jgi:DnaJ-class molecular chaperone
MENNFYAVLGVAPTAEPCVIRAAYRALCQEHHPDKAPEAKRAAATARLAEINDAYAVLGDAQKRKAYDGWCPAQKRSFNGAATRRRSHPH